MIPVAIDGGYENVKIVADSTHNPVEKRMLMTRSRARIGAGRVGALAGGDSGVREYETEGLIYAAGEVDGEPTHFDGYRTSALNRVIVQHALQLAELTGQEVEVATGLPVHTFYRNGVINQSLIDNVRRNFQIAVRPKTGAQEVRIVRHAVVPECVAAWYHLVIREDNGRPVMDNERQRMNIGIIDIGGRTTDYAVVTEQGIQFDSSGSINCGFIDIRDRVSSRVCQQFDMDHISERRVTSAINDRQIRINGRDHNIKPMIDEESRYVLERIRSEAARHMGKGSELDMVVFIGGGSLYFKEAIRTWFPHGTIPDHPEFMNALGMLKYIKYVG